MDETLKLDWDGSTWQKHAEQLLRLRHQTGGYQAVPDADRGDCGIEGFSLDDDCCYQCYAPQEPLTPQTRYEAQRKKITQDVAKFIQNKDKLIKVLAAMKIRRWLLVVPLHDSKETTAHCQKKTNELRVAKLPYAANDIFVGVVDQSEFVIERRRLLDEGLVRLAIPVDTAKSMPPIPTQLLKNLDSKIERFVDPARRSEVRDLFLQSFADGGSFLDKLRRQHNSIYERVVDKKRGRERNLALRSAISPAEPKQRLDEVLADVQGELEAIGALTSEQREALADEFVSDWLLRCPLQFPETP